MKIKLKAGPGAPKIESGGVPRVNLLPRTISAKREQRALFKSWGARVLASVVVVAAASAGMFGWQAVTALQLVAVQSEGTGLLAQMSAKGEIQRLLSTESELQDYSAEMMATDLNWTESIAKLLQNFPEGSWLCSFDFISGAAPEGTPEENVGLSGVIQICGPFPSAIPFLKDATSVPGVKKVAVLEGSYDTEISAYAHSIFVELDQTVYQSAEARVEGNKSQPETAESEVEPEGSVAAEQTAENAAVAPDNANPEEASA